MANRPTHDICLKREYEHNKETKAEFIAVGKCWMKDNGKLSCTLFSGDGAISIAGDFHIYQSRKRRLLNQI